MDADENISRLNDREARYFCSTLASKYNATNKISPHIENLRDYESIHGSETVYWLSEFLWNIPNEIYVIDDAKPFSVLRFPKGASVIAYLRDREWRGYQYFFSDASCDYLWGIWHEESVYACGTALVWLRERKLKLFELLSLTKDYKILLSEIRFLEWGRNIALQGEAQKDTNEDQQFAVSFHNCGNIHWNPPWTDTVSLEKVRVEQTYFGLRHSPIRDTPFFALLGKQFDICFDYEKVEVCRITI